MCMAEVKGSLIAFNSVHCTCLAMSHFVPESSNQDLKVLGPFEGGDKHSGRYVSNKSPAFDLCHPRLSWSFCTFDEGPFHATSIDS